MINRADPDQAREILSHIFGNRSNRQLRAYLTFLADDIDFLGRNYSDRWGVSLFRNRIRLNVGWVECVILDSDGLRVLVETESTPADKVFHNHPYKNARGCGMASVPLTELATELPQFEESHKAALAIAAKVPTNPSIRNAHSSGLVSYVSDVVNRKLNNPSYERSSGEPHFWVVKGRPSENNWARTLKPGQKRLWHTARPPKDLSEGDRVFLWSSSPDFRIVGLATIAQPHAGNEDNGDALFQLRYLTRKLSSTFTIHELRNVPVLGKASFLKPGPATTIHALGAEQAQILYRLLCTDVPQECNHIWPDLNQSANEELPDVDEAYFAREGDPRLVQHWRRERNRQVVEKKKSAALRKTGKLDCEVCSFNFVDAFGERGEDFCEVHHLVPLSALNGEVETRLEELAIVCSNCHRMLHRNPWIGIEELKGILRTSHKSLSERKTNKIRYP